MGKLRTCVCQNPACECVFTTSNSNHRGKFCSMMCYATVRWPGREKATVLCAHCGKAFKKPRYDIEHTKHCFCSRACHNAWRSEHQRGEAHHQYNRVMVRCTHCSKEFARIPSRRKTPFCSRECDNAWKRAHPLKGEASPRYNTILVQCANCGRGVRRQRWQAKGYNRSFCNMKCLGQWRSQYAVGENGANWRGGYAEYYGPDWLKQRRAARERDQYTCQRCGVTEVDMGRELDVHHTRPFREFGYKPGENDHHKAANELANLVSLCGLCHHAVEWKT